MNLLKSNSNNVTQPNLDKSQIESQNKFVDQGYESPNHEHDDININELDDINDRKVSLVDDKPQPNLNLKDMDATKDASTAESMLEFAILTIAQVFKLTPK